MSAAGTKKTPQDPRRNKKEADGAGPTHFDRLEKSGHFLEKSGYEVASTDRAAAGKAGARAVGRGLGGENGVVDPDRGVEGRVVETTADRRGR